MRVAFDARYLNGPSGGIATYCHSLLRTLSQLVPELELTLVTRAAGLKYELELPQCQELCFDAPPKSLRGLYGLSRALRRHAFDLYHGPFNIIPSGLALPSVVTIHDVMQLQDPANIATSRFVQHTAGLFWRTRIRHAAKHASHVAAVSQATRSALLEHVPGVSPERVSVTPNGVDEYFFAEPSEAERVELRRRVGEAPFVLCVGNESPHKNHARALHAFMRAFPGGDPLRFVLVRRSVRRDPEMVHLLAEPEVARRVIVLPHTELPLLRAAYHEAHVFFFPSWVEGFGIPILEAMAARTPVVTSDRNALAEVAGDAAVLADPFDVFALAEALQRASRDVELRSLLAARGLERARGFTWERCARATWQAYQRARDAERRLPA